MLKYAMPPSQPYFRVGPATFEVDNARLQQAVDRYEAGKGFIGGDPRRRPHWALPLPPEPAPAFRLLQSSAEHLERLAAFLTTGPIEIEIGSGYGEFILDWAAQHPDRRFLAFEVKYKLMRGLHRQSNRRGIANLWVSDDDARFDLPRLLPTGSVDAIHILFPDPWWRPKHRARRLFVPPFLDALAAILRPGGILRVATDVLDYAAYIQALVADHGAFAPDEPALASRFATAAPTARQSFCDELSRPYSFFFFTRRQS